MACYTQGEPLVAGLRCPDCGYFSATTAGDAIESCCWTEKIKQGRPYTLPVLEFHVRDCKMMLPGPYCERDCRCPCHRQGG